MWLVVTTKQLTIGVLLYSCNNIALKLTAIAAETFWWEHCE